MPAVFTIPAVFKAVDKISATQKKMAKSVKNFSRSARADMQRASLAFQNFNNKVKSVGKRITKTIGSLGVAFAGLALIGVLGGVINVFADFEQANAGLAAVMNVTVAENRALTEDAKRLGSITAKTASEVVGLQEAFARLGFERTDILNMTQATIAGSVAMKAELADTAELVGAMVKTFDALSSRDAGLINDQMVKSTQKSALNFEKLSTALPIVGGAANSLKIPFTRTLALLGKLSDAGIDASMSATALRKIFTTAASKGVPYQQLLQKVANSENSLATAAKLFGRTAAVQADILAKNISGVEKLDIALQSAAGTAQIAADKQLNTLQGRLTILGSAWEGFVLSVESGDGKFAKFLKTTVEVATEILAMATGTSKLESKLSKSEKTIRILANRAVTFLKVIKFIIAAYVSFRAIMLLTNSVLFAYNVVMGISGAITGAASIAIGQSTVAMVAYKTITGIVTAAQWLWNAALTANPIGLVIVAIVALIAGIVLLVRNWDVVKETMGRVFDTIRANPFLNFLFKPILLIIDAIKFLIRNFDTIKQTVVSVVSSIVNHFASLFELFRAIGNFIGAVFSIAFDKLSSIFTTAFDSVVDNFINPLMAKFTVFSNMMKSFGLKLIAPFKPLIDAFSSIGNAIEENVINKFKKIGGFVTGIINSVSNFFGGAAEKLNVKTEQIVKAHELEVKIEQLLKTPTGTNNVTKRLANDLVDNERNIINANTFNQSSPVIASNFNQQQDQKQENSRLDVFLNNRSSDTEIFTEGTGVNVQKTGN